jgi:hypothetical protein
LNKIPETADPFLSASHQEPRGKTRTLIERMRKMISLTIINPDISGRHIRRHQRIALREQSLIQAPAERKEDITVACHMLDTEKPEEAR